jgi:hypothetical protein
MFVRVFAQETNMVKTENSEVSLQEIAGQEEELVELGRASEETRGLFFGSVYELSILPLRLL